MEEKDIEQFKALNEEATEVRQKLGLANNTEALLIMIYDHLLDQRE